MTLLVIILIIAALAFIIFSIVLTVNLFKSFGADECTADERKEMLIRYRNRVLLSYAAAVLLITAAAAVKIILV